MGFTMQQKTKGFTLVELMVCVTIIGILLSVALPAYLEYLKDGRRADAQQYMMQRAGILERIYTRLGAYPAENEFVLDVSDYYRFSYSRLSATAFLLTAVPKGKQVGDRCGTLSFNHQGVMNAAQDICWG